MDDDPKKEEKKELAGITFYLDSTDLQGMHNGKLTARLSLTAVVDDEALLERVKAKFEGGFSIHTAGDFKEQMIRVLQEDVGDAARRTRALEATLRAERGRRETAERELQMFKDAFNFLKGPPPHA